ncbi:MAG: hypothetical protein JO006_15260 [Paucibacter sp.]|nr:hypothetical protein [Roseateles sp.]
MKPSSAVLASGLLALALALPALADEPAPPVNSLSFNGGVASDYRYRGISQTRLKPALQGGADYADAGGFYVGTWLSTIQWIKDAGGDASAEWDIYGGYKTGISKGVTLDVGVLQYEFVNNKLPNANTFEVYGALSIDVFTAKYSHSLTNLFGFADSKGSGYLDLSAALDVGEGFTLTPHVGHQFVHHNSPASYTDYSLTLNKDYAGFTWGLAVVGTNADKSVYTYVPRDKFLGKTSAVLSIKKTF